uniref:Uncharacterized protein n=1 Tax=Saimiri boliviensis boliviensis TaxID=39432 RepID=A0A2K6S609_SAIBB
MSPSTLLPSPQKEEDEDSVSLFPLPSFPKCLSICLAVPRSSPCHIPAPHFLARIVASPCWD